VHLCLEFIYTRGKFGPRLLGEVARDWSAGLVQVPEPGLGIKDWWKNSLNNLPKAKRNYPRLLLLCSCIQLASQEGEESKGF